MKARDSYGLVFDDIKKMQAMKQLQAIEAGPNPPPPGTVFPSEPESSAQSSESAVVPYADPVIAQRNNPTPGNQIQLLRKAPTMPKPKWHAPWKLFRVIAGHLGWVRCVAVEPGNEVLHYGKLIHLHRQLERVYL